MSQATKATAPAEGAEGQNQENIPLRNEELPPPAYNPDAAITQGVQIPSVYPTAIGTTSIAAPAAPEGQPLNPRQTASSNYPAGVVIVPITDSSQYPAQAYSNQRPMPPNQAIIVTQHPPPPHGPHHGPHGPHPHHAGHPPPPAAGHINDDPTCIYIFAIIAFFIPLIGLLAMCIYNCGTGLPPRQAGAFKLLCLSTLVSILIAVIFSASG